MDEVNLSDLIAGNEVVRGYFRKRPVLVTGGMGFIGSNLVHSLITLDARVTVLDNLSPAYGGNRFNLEGVADRAEFLEMDQGEPKALGPVVRRFDDIFNLVGQVSHVDSMENPFTDLYTNVTAQASLLEACRRANARAFRATRRWCS